MLHMKRKDSTKTYGIIGLILIITAFVIWGFVMPALNKSLDDDMLNTVIEQPTRSEQNNKVPVTDAPIPPRP